MLTCRKMKNILLFLLIPCMTYSQTLSEKESCEIYNSCLIGFTKDSTGKFLVRESTVYYNCDWESLELNKLKLSPFNEQLPIDSSFIDLFKMFKQSDTSSIDLNFLTKCCNNDSISIFQDKQYQSCFKERGNGFNNFHKYFKDYYCFYEFSKIAITEDHKYAILYMNHNCDDLSASGYLLLCQKESNGWIVKHSIMLWIS